jgi:hypothetical protein
MRPPVRCIGTVARSCATVYRPSVASVHSRPPMTLSASLNNCQAARHGEYAPEEKGPSERRQREHRPLKRRSHEVETDGVGDGRHFRDTLGRPWCFHATGMQRVARERNRMPREG